MEELPRNLWKRLSRLFPADGEATDLAAEWFREYESDGALSRPAAEVMAAPLPVVADFFRRVSLMYSPETPILRRRDTRWMSEFDYTLFNIRGAGVKGKAGNYLSAAMMLATLRTKALVLAPVTRGRHDDLFHLESHALLREELTCPQARAAGLGDEAQMAAFCEAAHLLGFALGFDMDYRVDPLAAVVVNRPDLFLWTKDGFCPSTEKEQEELRQEVLHHVKSVRASGVVPSPEVYDAALKVPGLAASPTTDGTERTPLSFYSSVDGEEREGAVKYWGKVFDLWRDRYGFDFLVLRGTSPETGPEAPQLALIRKAADRARKAGVRRNIGVAAEGNAFDVEDYGVQGADLVIAGDGEERADYEWFRSTVHLDEKLRRINLGRKLRFSVPIVVNPGNVESKPRRERALMKRFVARFLGTGPSRRPLMETMGALEGAWGYNESLRKPISLGWMPDEEDAKRAQVLEAVAQECHDILDTGERVDKHLDDRCAWWVIRSKRGLLVAIVSVENEDLLPPPGIKIDYSSYAPDGESKTVLEHDFRENRGVLCLSTDTVIDVDDVPYRGFRLYVVN